MIFYLFLEMLLVIAVLCGVLSITHPGFLVPAIVLGVVVGLEA